MILYHDPNRPVNSCTFVFLPPFESTIRIDDNPIAVYRLHVTHDLTHLCRGLLCFLYLPCASTPSAGRRQPRRDRLFKLLAYTYASSRGKLYASQSYVAQWARSM